MPGIDPQNGKVDHLGGGDRDSLPAFSVIGDDCYAERTFHDVPICQDRSIGIDQKARTEFAVPGLSPRFLDL